MKFKKIKAVFASALMAGMTIGAAAAANYPAPFVENGVANAAVVYGASSVDQSSAATIQGSLGTFVKSGATTVEGGEAFALDKDSKHFHLGMGLDDVYSDLSDDEMPTFLAEGTFDDGDIDTDYEQKIVLGTEALKLFADSDYQDEEPTIGFYMKDKKVLDYTIEFDDKIEVSTSNNELEDTDMPLMGNTYYVLSADANKIELLDSAESTIMAEGETVTVNGKTVVIEYIADNAVKFKVNGETTKKLAGHDYEELEDGSYITIEEILYEPKDSGVSKVEFSIGNGKLVLDADGDEVEMNDDNVEGLTSSYNIDGDKFDTITLTWTTDGEEFLTDSNAFVMPGFETIKVLFGGMDFPSESEKISLEKGEDLTLDMGNFDIEIMSTIDGSNWTQGTQDNLLIIDGDLDSLEEDQRFIVTVLDEDLSDTENLYYEVSNIKKESDGDITVELNDLIGDKDLTFDSLGDEETRGDVTFTLNNVTGDVANITISSDETLAYNKVVSDKGMIVEIPAAGANAIKFYEANEDEELETSFSAPSIVATAKWDSDDEVIYADYSTTDMEEESDDKYITYKESAVASKISVDTDADSFEVEYYGKEVKADVKIASTDAKVSSASALGDILVKDSEIESVKSKNLVIVGGSCVNSAAATVLGGAYCGSAFTDATGVNAGEFLIKGVQDAFTDGKLALVVAGYEAADTVNAATFLTKKDVDTSKVYKGTSATEASLVAEAN